MLLFSIVVLITNIIIKNVIKIILLSTSIRIGIKIFSPIKDFLKNLIHKPLIIMITKMLGTILFVSGQILIHGFLTRMKKCKKAFQTGFKNGVYLWVTLQIFYVMKFKNLLNMSKPIVIDSNVIKRNLQEHYY